MYPWTISLLPVLDQFDEGVIITDTHGVILYMNDTRAKIDDLRIGKAIENLACYYRTHLGKVISSVNVLPHAAIESGSMRADLFYRLAVVFINIPPLRERMEDLDRLTTHFLDNANGHLERAANAIAPYVTGRFKRYTWPGNVRELEHVIEGAMNRVGTEATIQMHHLTVPLLMKNPQQTDAPPPGGSANHSGRFNPAFSESSKDPTFSDPSLAEMKTKSEIANIQAALAATRGKAAGAALRLGISPKLMHYKLKRFSIDRLDFRKNSSE